MKWNGWKGTARAITLVASAVALPACGENPTQPSDDAPPFEVTQGPITSLVINGLVYPMRQFEEVPPDRCGAPHWHAHGVVYSLGHVGTLGTLTDRRSIECHAGLQFPGTSDPDPGGCGFGRVSEVPRIEVWVSTACLRAFEGVVP